MKTSAPVENAILCATCQPTLFIFTLNGIVMNSGQWLENVDRSHQVLARGKIALSKIQVYVARDALS